MVPPYSVRPICSGEGIVDDEQGDDKNREVDGGI